MKRIKIFIFLFLIFAVPAFSQVFQNYKVVVRNSEGVLISNKTTTIKLEIQENSGYGKTLYAEMHQRTTSENGIAVIDIGA
ncbi:MAG: hypothetical protein HOA90_16190, partial [Prolixibacteraceae bacterium]|nr:hypothetical protein [Prolixibacteraceae bacterium]